MKIALLLVFIVLLTVGSAPADASLLVDPTAAALGSSSIFDPVEMEEERTVTPAVRNTPAHWGRTQSSDIYLVRRDDRRSSWSFRPEAPDDFRPPTPTTETVQVGKSARPERYVQQHRIRDARRREWIGLRIRRERPPVVVIPRGGDQPHTPTTPAPEPATVMLLASGLGAVGAARFARRKQAPEG